MSINKHALSRMTSPSFDGEVVREFGFLVTERAEAAIGEEFEAAYHRVIGLPASHSVIGVASGTAALKLVAQGLDLRAGDLVIVPPLSWAATWTAFADGNLIPVPVELDPNTLGLDLADLRRKLPTLSRRPVAIVSPPLFNSIGADIDELVSLAFETGQFLIGDGAQSAGARYRDLPLCTYYTAETSSNQRTKPENGRQASGSTKWRTPTGSEGGTIVTGVPELDQRIRSLRTGGRPVAGSAIAPTVPVDPITQRWIEMVAARDLRPDTRHGDNLRLPAAIAERLIDHLDRFPAEYQRRVRTLSSIYRRLPQETIGVELLTQSPQVTSSPVHMLALKVDFSQFGGLSNADFREVLSYKLGGALVDKAYDPIGGAEGYSSPHYNPHLQARHAIDGMPEALDPSRYSLPVTHATWKTVVVIEGTALEDGERFVDGLIDALRWMHDHADELPALVEAE